MIFKELFQAISNRSAFERLFQVDQVIGVSGERFKPQLIYVRPWPIAENAARHSYIAKLRGFGFEGEGVGSAHLKELAIQKAIAESYERLVFRLLRQLIRIPNSNGMAAHPREAQARWAALEEALERDSLLVQWLTKTPMHEVEGCHLPEVLNWLAKLKFRFEHLLVSNRGFISTATLTVRIPTSDVRLIAHGSGPNLDRAIVRASYELERLSSVISKIVHLNVDYSKLGDPFLEHLVFSSERFRTANWMLGPKISIAKARSLWQPLNRKLYESFASDIRTLAGPSIYVASAKSSRLQTLFLGSTEMAESANQLNLSRISPSDINKDLHFVG